jgi:hypothetical protein
MEGNPTIETERQAVNAKLWPVLTELENALPLSGVTLGITSRHYRFTIFRPDEGMAHVLAFDRLEFDALSLEQILGGMMEQEILGALELAPIAIEMTVQQSAVHVTAIRRMTT